MRGGAAHGTQIHPRDLEFVRMLILGMQAHRTSSNGSSLSSHSFSMVFIVSHIYGTSIDKRSESHLRSVTRHGHGYTSHVRAQCLQDHYTWPLRAEHLLRDTRYALLLPLSNLNSLTLKTWSLRRGHIHVRCCGRRGAHRCSRRCTGRSLAVVHVRLLK